MSVSAMQKMGPVNTTQSPYAHWHTLPSGSVRLETGFWANEQALNRRSSLEHGYHMLEKAGNFHNMRVAAGREQGEYRGRIFIDTDIYKWLEAVAYELGKTPDAGLQRMANEAIELIVAAQQPDGYLNTYIQIAQPDQRFVDLDHGHEMYSAGHLFQAAVAWHRAVGDARLLGVAQRFADYIDSLFGPDKRHGTDGHPEVEMALVELYRETGEARYLALAKFFIDERGKGKMSGLGWYGPEYHQDRVPVRQATEIEGHAVRALYLMSGVTDVYLETGEQALFDASVRLWRDMTAGKLHVTGGAGARYEGESFGSPYELPSDQCYCETCAAIASMMWNWRMLLAAGQAQYADLLEQTLYNSVLSGDSTDGKHYFYINPLLSRGGYERAEWYSVACCPPNIMRTIASVEHYIATSDAQGIQVHLYGASTIATPPESGHKVTMHMVTDYPWHGQIKITISETESSPWTLSLRIPGWCQEASIQVNGTALDVPTSASSYAAIRRTWKPGDTIELNLVMTPRFLEGHPFIDATRDSVAIQRGPLVYCLEQVDHKADLMAVQVDEYAPLETTWTPDLLGGVMVITAAGYLLNTQDWTQQLYRPLETVHDLKRQPIPLKAVPYYLWGNRGADVMRVWIPRGGKL